MDQDQINRFVDCNANNVRRSAAEAPVKKLDAVMLGTLIKGSAVRRIDETTAIQWDESLVTRRFGVKLMMKSAVHACRTCVASYYYNSKPNLTQQHTAASAPQDAAIKNPR